MIATAMKAVGGQKCSTVEDARDSVHIREQDGRVCARMVRVLVCVRAVGCTVRCMSCTCGVDVAVIRCDFDVISCVRCVFHSVRILQKA